MRALSKNPEIDLLFHTMAEIIYETERAHGGDFWPFSPMRLHPIVADPFLKELHRMLKELEEKGYTSQDMARLFVNPNRVADYNFLWGFIRDLPPEDGEYVAAKLVQILSVLRTGNPFSTDNRNTVWSDEQVKQKLSCTRLIDLGERTELKRLISRIETLLTLYAELLYFIFPGFSRMYHGPYHLNGKTIFAKEFIDLKPTWLWEFTNDFPFSRYLNIGTYRDIQIKVNFVGLVEADKPFPHGLTSASLFFDGDPVTEIGEIKELVDIVQTKVNAYTQAVRSYSEMDLLRQGIKMFFYSLRPLYQALNEDIYVPPDILSVSQETRGGEKPKPLGDLTKEEAIEKIKQNIDVRYKKLKNIRILAFDFIGVIAEPNLSFDTLKFINTVTENSHLPLNEQKVLFEAWHNHLKTHGGDPLDSIKRIGSFFNNLKDLPVETIKLIGKEVEGIIANQFYILKRGMKELLIALHQKGYILHIITHVPRSTIDRFLIGNELGDLIKKIYSEETGKIKDSLYKNIFDDAAELGFKQFQILIIDDEKKNLEKAKKTEFITLLLTDSDVSIEMEHADFVASDLKDIMKKL